MSAVQCLASFLSLLCSLVLLVQPWPDLLVLTGASLYYHWVLLESFCFLVALLLFSGLLTGQQVEEAMAQE